ncbi:MAG: 2OG-Fe(II) oxygenase [Alphaproteobacteria bacterium]|nr:2OG-Fe(II) oxygenase [Alphaproteobacteria bacterium]
MTAQERQPFDVVLKANPAIIEQFRAGLLARLRERPDATEALRCLGRVCRTLGELEEARACYERLVALAPDDTAARHAASVLRGRPEPSLFDPNAAMMPPFVHLKEFLPEPSVELLFEAVADMADAFRPSAVGYEEDRRIDPEMRRSVSALANDRVRALVLDPVRATIAALGLAERLGVRVGPDGPVMTQVHCHRGGDFFTAHRDGTDLRHPRRELTFVYYFHRRPRRFTGGDLYVYDAGLNDELRGDGMAFTRIEPAHNSLILFPSRALHEVAPVACDSDDLLDGRLAVTGWMAQEERQRGGPSPSGDHGWTSRAGRLLSMAKLVSCAHGV